MDLMRMENPRCANSADGWGGRDGKDYTCDFLSPHTPHAGSNVNARTLACGTGRGTTYRNRPRGLLEQAEQPIRDEPGS
jgi:hypothetical protein